MTPPRTAPLLAGLLLAGAAPLGAAQLHLEPVLLDLNAPVAAGVLTLRNEEDHEVTVQSRVFRWSQVDGVDQLTATSDVVASPPAVQLLPGQNYTVRIVRAVKRAVAAEESYRVVVDELPDAAPGVQNGISILVRQSVPVFFRARRLSPPDVRWSVQRQGDQLDIIAANGGDTRLRIANLQVRDAAGNTVEFGRGLAGYALGRSSIRFTGLPLPQDLGHGGPVTIMAETNNGPVTTTTALPARP